MAGKKRPPQQRFEEDAQKPLDALHGAFERLRKVIRKGGHTEAKRVSILDWLDQQIESTHDAFSGYQPAQRLDLSSAADHADEEPTGGDEGEDDVLEPIE